jgi:hypothetical protein
VQIIGFPSIACDGGDADFATAKYGWGGYLLEMIFHYVMFIPTPSVR